MRVVMVALSLSLAASSSPDFLHSATAIAAFFLIRMRFLTAIIAPVTMPHNQNLAAILAMSLTSAKEKNLILSSTVKLSKNQ